MYWKGLNSLDLLIRIDRALNASAPANDRIVRIQRVIDWSYEQCGGTPVRNKLKNAADLLWACCEPESRPVEASSSDTCAKHDDHLYKKFEMVVIGQDKQVTWPPTDTDAIPLNFSRLAPSDRWVFERDGTIGAGTQVTPWDKRIELKFEVPSSSKAETTDYFSMTGWDLPPLIFPSPPCAQLPHPAQILAQALHTATHNSPDEDRAVFHLMDPANRTEVLQEYKFETRKRCRIRVVLEQTSHLVIRPLPLSSNVSEAQGKSWQDIDMVAVDPVDGSIQLAPCPSTGTFPQALVALFQGPRRLTMARVATSFDKPGMNRYLDLHKHLKLSKETHVELLNTLGVKPIDPDRIAVFSAAGSVDVRPASLAGSVITVCSGIVLFLAERLPTPKHKNNDDAELLGDKPGPWEAGVLGPESSAVVPFGQRIILYHLTDTLILKCGWNHSVTAEWWHDCLLANKNLHEQQMGPEIVRSIRFIIPTCKDSQADSNVQWVSKAIDLCLKRCSREVKREVTRLAGQFEQIIASHTE